MKTLQTPYLKVDTKNGTAYGGNQAWLPYKFLKGMGCGLISAADVIFHLERKENITEAEYVSFAKKLWKWYLNGKSNVLVNKISVKSFLCSKDAVIS